MLQLDSPDVQSNIRGSDLRFLTIKPDAGSAIFPFFSKSSPFSTSLLGSLFHSVGALDGNRNSCCLVGEFSEGLEDFKGCLIADNDLPPRSRHPT